MKTPKIYYCALAVFCALILFIGMVNAADVTQSAEKSFRFRDFGHPGADMTNATMQQQFIARLEEQGVDVTEVRTALQNGDTDAVKTWFENYRAAHQNEMPAGCMNRRSQTQSTP